MILNYATLEKKEIDITVLEKKLSNFSARFTYVLNPWKFQEYMTYIPEIGKKRKNISIL